MILNHVTRVQFSVAAYKTLKVDMLTQLKKQIYKLLPLSGEDLVKERCGKALDWFSRIIQSGNRTEEDTHNLLNYLKVSFTQSDNFPLESLGANFGKLCHISDFINVFQYKSGYQFSGELLDVESDTTSTNERIFLESMLFFKNCLVHKPPLETFKSYDRARIQEIVNIELNNHLELQYSAVDYLINLTTFLTFSPEAQNNES